PAGARHLPPPAGCIQRELATSRHQQAASSGSSPPPATSRLHPAGARHLPPPAGCIQRELATSRHQQAASSGSSPPPATSSLHPAGARPLPLDAGCAAAPPLRSAAPPPLERQPRVIYKEGRCVMCVMTVGPAPAKQRPCRRCERHRPRLRRIFGA